MSASQSASAHGSAIPFEAAHTTQPQIAAGEHADRSHEEAPQAKRSRQAESGDQSENAMQIDDPQSAAAPEADQPADNANPAHNPADADSGSDIDPVAVRADPGQEGRVNPAALLVVLRDRLAKFESTFDWQATQETLAALPTPAAVAWACHVLDTPADEQAYDPVDDPRVVDAFDRLAEEHDLRIATVEWGSGYNASTLLVGGSGDESGIVAMTQVAVVNIEALARSVANPSIKQVDAWKTNAIHIKLARRTIFCIVRAALSRTRPVPSLLDGVQLATGFATTAQKYVKAGCVASHELTTVMDIPTAAAVAKVAYRVGVTVRRSSPDAAPVATVAVKAIRTQLLFPAPVEPVWDPIVADREGVSLPGSGDGSRRQVSVNDLDGVLGRAAERRLLLEAINGSVDPVMAARQTWLGRTLPPASQEELDELSEKFWTGYVGTLGAKGKRSALTEQVLRDVISSQLMYGGQQAPGATVGGIGVMGGAPGGQA